MKEDSNLQELEASRRGQCAVREAAIGSWHGSLCGGGGCVSSPSTPAKSFLQSVHSTVLNTPNQSYLILSFNNLSLSLGAF